MSCSCKSRFEEDVLPFLRDIKTELGLVTGKCKQIEKELFGISNESEESPVAVMETTTVRQILERLAFDVDWIKREREELKKQAEDTRRREEEGRRKEVEAKRRAEEETKRKEEEVTRSRAEEALRKQEEYRRKEAEAKREQEERRKRVEEAFRITEVGAKKREKAKEGATVDRGLSYWISRKEPPKQDQGLWEAAAPSDKDGNLPNKYIRRRRPIPPYYSAADSGDLPTAPFPFPPSDNIRGNTISVNPYRAQNSFSLDDPFDDLTLGQTPSNNGSTPWGYATVPYASFQDVPPGNMFPMGKPASTNTLGGTGNHPFKLASKSNLELPAPSSMDWPFLDVDPSGYADTWDGPPPPFSWVVNPMSSSSFDSSAPHDTNIACPKCTYRNPQHRVTCQMCESRLGQSHNFP